MTTVDGRDETLHYDQLIVSVGSVSRVLPVPGLAEHGLGFKTLADAIAMRNRALLNLEIAESLPDDESRSEYLTFVFVGAGYAGLEGIAELQDYMADVIDRYPRCRMIGTRFVLVEARDRVMPEIPASLAEFATRELRARGMEIRTGTMLTPPTPARSRCPPASASRPGCCAGPPGSRPRPWCAGWACRSTRVAASRWTPRCGWRARTNVWAIGDAAAVPDPAKHRRAPSPPTCQHAIRQGRRVAENVAATIAGKPPKPFRYRTLGVFVDMGQHKAVATLLGLRLRGFPAWFAARSYHLAMMPGLARQVRLAADWTVGLLFGRASAELGQLGHPEALERAARSRDWRPLLPRGPRERPSRHVRAGRGRARRVAQGARAAASRAPACARGPRRPLEPGARPPRVHRGAGRRSVRDLRGGRRDGRLHADRPLRRDGRADRAVGGAVALRVGGGSGAARTLLARAADARSRPRGARHRQARGPDALHAVRRDAGQRSLAHAPPHRGVHRAPLPGDRRPSAHRARADARSER